MRRPPVLVSTVALTALLLAGCGSDDDGGDSGSGAASGTTSESSAAASPAQDVALTTADTDLGTVVVDADGMTVYVFDRDTPGSGTSSCTGQCLQAWPPVVADSEDPVGDGVTGEIGTITRDDGTRQLTLEGWPLYLWQSDTAPGDTTGQGVQGVWWVVTPDGTKVTETAAPAAVPVVPAY